MGRSFLAALWLLVLPALAVADTRVDINHSKNFSQYKTFAVEIAPPIDQYGDVDENNTILVDRLRRAVAYQLVQRGLQQSDNPDLIIRVSSRENERTELNSFGGPYPYYGYGWGGAYWGPWGYWGGDVYTYTYLEERVVVDVRERATGDLVYRAQVRREAEDDLDDLAEHTSKTARKAFKDYPIRMRNGD